MSLWLIQVLGNEDAWKSIMVGNKSIVVAKMKELEDSFID
ncbi:hypothetical protein DesLBE_4157 [Desulfitobacterium sp. LBE]|nr:hypothetical protein DesLBE_4157 [Desulfitobacterium sp. LBE]